MHFFFLVRSYKAFGTFDLCIDSIKSQRQKDYTIIFVDDASNYSSSKKNHIQKKLSKHIVVFNKERKFSLRNAYETIHKFVGDKDIVVNVDGDDWLIRDDVLELLVDVYKTDSLFSYGNCVFFNPGQVNHNRLATKHYQTNHRYPREVEKRCSYRSHPFLPLHLRSWRASVFKEVDVSNFLRPDGEFLRTCEDQAIFFPMLEKSEGKYAVIDVPMYAYNISHKYNDSKINVAEKLFDEVLLRRKKHGTTT